jgi:hypothetical protein
MNIKITINTDNDAFQEDMTEEVLRILRVISAKLMRNEIDIHVGEDRKVMDINGNCVGKFTVKR